MNIQTEVTPRARPIEVEHHKLRSVAFHQTLVLWSESSVSVDKGYAIVPARLTASLDWRECSKDEQPTGVGLTKVAKSPSGARAVQRCYVPMSNVAEINYSE